MTFIMIINLLILMKVNSMNVWQHECLENFAIQSGGWGTG